MNSYILDENGQRLVEENMELVPFTINRYFKSYISDEDIISTGYIGLCKAAVKYDPESSIRFSTFAVNCIFNEIMSEIKKRFVSNKYNDMPVISLNQPVCQDGSEFGDELLNQIPDESIDIENEVIGNIIYNMVSSAASYFTPTYNMLQREHINIADIARRERKTRQCINSRMQREFRRARLFLEKIGITL